MKNIARTAVALILGCGVLGISANAETSRYFSNTSFEGHIAFCAPREDPVNVVHLPNGGRIETFINVGNVWVTGNPLVDGVEKNIVEATFPGENQPPSSVVIRGKVNVDALRGIWLFKQRLNVGPNGEGFGIGFGLGELRGKLILFETGNPEPLPESPCGPTFGAPLTGRVLRFGWIS